MCVNLISPKSTTPATIGSGATAHVQHANLWHVLAPSSANVHRSAHRATDDNGYLLVPPRKFCLFLVFLFLAWPEQGLPVVEFRRRPAKQNTANLRKRDRMMFQLHVADQHQDAYAHPSMYRRWGGVPCRGRGPCGRAARGGRPVSAHA